MQLLINVDVDDLQRAVDFYERGLGLRVGRRLFESTVVEMLGAPAPIYLMAKEPGTPASERASQPRDYRRHWTPVHLDFVVDDLEVATHQALAAGAELEGELQSFDWGRQATLSDPFGHGFCLVEWAGGGYDRAL